MRQVFRSDAEPIFIGEDYNPDTAVKSDEDIVDFIENNVMGIFNPATTCSLGSSVDLLAVLDSQARVYVVTGLGIVDASSFRFLPLGYPQVTVCGFFSFYPSLIMSEDFLVDVLLEKIAAKMSRLYISQTCE